MAEASLLLVVAVIIIGAIISFRVLSSLLKTALLALAVTAIVLAIALGLVVKDASDLRSNFGLEKKVLITGSNGTMIRQGMLLSGGNQTLLTEAQLDSLNAYLASGDYKAIKGDSYKVLFIRQEALNGTGDLNDLLMLMIESIKNGGIKSGAITVYPETPFFRAVKALPSSLFSRISEKLVKEKE